MQRAYKAYIFAILTTLLALAAVGASAWTIDDIIYSGAAGSGSSVAACIIDFGDASYAFKYYFDGNPTGFDMLVDLTDDTIGVPGFDFHYTLGEYGTYVDGFAYDGHSAWELVYPDWWQYWTGTAGNPLADPGIGCSSRVLSSNEVDGWIVASGYPATDPPDIPMVPEPSSATALCSLIALAGSVRLLRLRRK